MVAFSPSAVEAALQAIAAGDEPALGLRITAEGGGCHGPQCFLGIEDHPEPGDKVFVFGDLKVFVDPASLPLVEGCSVDFVTDDRGQGFVFDNPAWKKRGSGGCSCGGGGKGHG